MKTKTTNAQGMTDAGKEIRTVSVKKSFEPKPNPSGGYRPSGKSHSFIVDWQMTGKTS